MFAEYFIPEELGVINPKKKFKQKCVPRESNKLTGYITTKYIWVDDEDEGL